MTSAALLATQPLLATPASPDHAVCGRRAAAGRPAPAGDAFLIGPGGPCQAGLQAVALDLLAHLRRPLSGQPVIEVLVHLRAPFSSRSGASRHWNDYSHVNHPGHHANAPFFTTAK